MRTRVSTLMALSMAVALGACGGGDDDSAATGPDGEGGMAGAGTAGTSASGAGGTGAGGVGAGGAGTAGGGAGFWGQETVVMWPYKEHFVNNDGKAGGINVEKTAAAMHDVGITGFTAFVRSGSELEEVIAKLEMFKDTDIKTWAVSSGLCKVISMTCPELSEELAKLSLEYPNLQVYLLDDYHPLDQKKIDAGLTPEHIESVIDAKNAYNPELRAIPTLYMHDEIEVFAAGSIWEHAFRDGTTMWYWDTWKGGSNPSFDVFKGYVDQCNQEVSPVPWIAGFYTLHVGELKQTGVVDNLFHDSQMIYDMARYAHEQSQGVALFSFPLFVYDLDGFMQATVFQPSTNDDPAFDYLLESKHGVLASWFQSIQTTVPVGGTKNVRVRFDMKDTRTDQADLEGYEFKQLLVNGDVVWESDIAKNGTSRFSVDKTVSVSGANAKIEIRQYAKEINTLFTRVYVDNPQVTVNGSSVATSWAFDSGMTHLQRYVDTYNAVKHGLKGLGPP